MSKNNDNIPVLIGSYALQKYGFTSKELGNENETDIDIICKLFVAQQFLWFADKKITPRLFGYNDTTVSKLKIIDISLYDECSSGKKVLYDSCNKLISSYVTIDLRNYSPQVLLPPIEWLYALLRGHIHRIPKVTLSQEKNILIWEKYMIKYHAIRDKIGYKKLDGLLQNEEDIPFQIFNAEFDYVTRTIGDAPSLEDKPEDTFFNDKVLRYIPHDDLHIQVAMMNRGADAKPLYSQFQSNPNSVEMDKDLFLSATKEDQINTLKEEIMVLYLERKALPNAVENQQMLDEFDFKQDQSKGKNKDGENDEETSYKQSYCKRDFRDVVCHFVTNLCGSGHSWLRQYCLDHWTMLININSYPISKLCTFANSFNHAARLCDFDGELPNRISTLNDFIQYHEKVLDNDGNDIINEALLALIKPTDKKKFKLFDFTIAEEKREQKHYYNYGYGSRNQLLPAVSGCSNELFIDYDTFISNLSKVKNEGDEYQESDEDQNYNIVLLPDQSKLIQKIWKDNFECINPLFILNSEYDGDILYNPARKIAISIAGTVITIYIVESSTDSSKGITFGVHKMSLYSLNDDDNCVLPLADGPYDACNTNFSIENTTSSIYESTCNGGYDRDIDMKYLNKYGRSFGELSGPLETLSRIILEFYRDEDEEDHK